MNYTQIKLLESLRLKAQAGKTSAKEDKELNRLHALHMQTLTPSWVLDTAKAIIKDYRRDEHELGIL